MPVPMSDKYDEMAREWLKSEAGLHLSDTPGPLQTTLAALLRKVRAAALREGARLVAEVPTDKVWKEARNDVEITLERVEQDLLALADELEGKND